MSAAQGSCVRMDRLPNRVLGALYRGGVDNPEKLCACPEEHVRWIVDVGKKAMSEIRSFMESIGSGFAPERSWEGCRCPACVGHEKRRRAWRASHDDRPLPANVLPFRPRAHA